MSDDEKKKPDFVSINGIDITEHVQECAFGPAWERSLPTLYGRPIVPGPITIAGVWDDGRVTCSVCGERFTPGPEGTATLTNTESGESLGVVCPSCGTALVAPREP